MGKEALSKFMLDIQTVWKTHYGLYTQYIGYFTADMAKALSIIHRIDNSVFRIMLEKQRLSIADLNNEIDKYRDYNIREFPYDREIDSVIPKLLACIVKYDFDENMINEKEWNDYISYLDKKSGRR